MMNAGAGPRKPTASMSAANAAETVSDAEYRAATSSAATAHDARIAASAVGRSPRSESASPTSPTPTSMAATAVARPGWGRLGASITCEKLARAPHEPYESATSPHRGFRRERIGRARRSPAHPARVGRRGTGGWEEWVVRVRPEWRHIGVWGISDRRRTWLEASFPARGAIGELGGTIDRTSGGRLVEKPRVAWTFSRKAR